MNKALLDKLTTGIGSVTVISAGITQFWSELQPVFAMVADDPLPYVLAFGYWVSTYAIGKDR